MRPAPRDGPDAAAAIAIGDTPPMRLYLAGPLFSSAERAWNAAVTAALRAAGHDVFLPQEQESGLDAAAIFATDVAGIDAAEALVAMVDGADADSGTAWEIGYAAGRGTPVVLVRTDLRSTAGAAGPYNPMLAESATVRIDLPAATAAEVVAAIIEGLSRIEATTGDPAA